MIQHISWDKFTFTGRLFAADRRSPITSLFLVKCIISMIIDICMYFTATIASYRFLAWTLFTPAERGFSCADQSIREKYYDNTVPTLTLLGITLGGPFFIIVLADLLGKLQKPYKELTHVINHSTFVYLDYVIAFWLSTLTLDVIKCFVGRTRPNFLEMCSPKEFHEICTMDPDAFVPMAHCTSNWKSSRNSKLSFPSGHAAISVFATLFLFFYLRGAQKRHPHSSADISDSMLSTPPQSSSGGSRPLCRYFASNICFKGENCEFSHNRNARPDMTCHYYLQGACSYGSKCRYDHVRPNRGDAKKIGPASVSTNKAVATLVNKSTIPKVVTKLSASSKSFVPAPIPEANPWQTSSLNNFHQNMGLELELISQENAACSNNWTAGQKGTISDLPLCPYFEVGFCPEGDFCRFIHGLPCEMCGLNVLHPQNEVQRINHHRECLAEHEKQMEAAFAEAKSAQMQCGICMELIMEKGLRFGILQNCTHCYCLECIRKWRKHNDELIKTKTVRSCPECRIHSDYVIPSKTWIDDMADKEKLIKLFHDNTKKIQCKYVQGGDVDKCPFGNKCFYKHQLPDGTIIEGKSPSTLRRERTRRLELYDFIRFSSSDEGDDSDFDDLFWN